MLHIHINMMCDNDLVFYQVRDKEKPLSRQLLLKNIRRTVRQTHPVCTQKFWSDFADTQNVTVSTVHYKAYCR